MINRKMEGKKVGNIFPSRSNISKQDDIPVRICWIAEQAPYEWKDGNIKAALRCASEFCPAPPQLINAPYVSRITDT